MKGGVGKTTLTVNIGYSLAEQHNKKVLIVDVDPQFNASTYLMSDTNYFHHLNTKHTILDIFTPNRFLGFSTVKGKKTKQKKKEVSKASAIANIYNGTNGKLDLLPSTLQLMQIQHSERGTENRLKVFLDKLKDTYDYILIDCPPTISIFTQSAILASDKYVVPLKPDPLSTIGIPLLEAWLDDYTQTVGVDLDSVGIVFCMVRNPHPKNMQKVISDIKKERKKEVFKEYLSMTTKVSESVESHIPIYKHVGNHRCKTEIEKITNEFLNRTDET
jgi:chromosome partitioning protein